MKLMAKKDLDVLGLRAGESTPPANKKDAKEAAGAVTALDTGGSDNPQQRLGTNRAFQTSVQAKVDLAVLPTIHVDLIGDLKLPLDDMYYIWTQDKVPPQPKVPKTNSRQAGFTRGDLDQLNSIKPFEGGDEILVKDKFKTHDLADLMLAAGSAHAPLKKKAGPLSVSNVGLKYKGKTLSVILDANFDLGPLAFALLGFRIDLEINTLDTLKDIKVGFNLDGHSAAFDKPPLAIAGIIRQGNAGGIQYYAGGLIFSYIPYQFMAAGFYGKVSKEGEAPLHRHSFLPSSTAHWCRLVLPTSRV
ncbi:hypothetical protein PG999_014814 [Apiospora kogelbergensis]|uniref:DUF6603 domain-containing protein n=1 Tax=Apiospora kogelbergensis TaxID=1337665 RepID=A0AAW0Q2J3_9PEZI